MQRFRSAFLFTALLAVGAPGFLLAQDGVPPGSPLLLENGVESLRVEAGTDSFPDPFSGYRFPTRITVVPVDGSVYRMRATGSGGRKKLIFKVYGAAFYTDEGAPLGSDPARTLVTEDLPRRIVLRFLRNASHERLDGVFQEAIEKLWEGGPGPDVAPDIERLLSYFESGVRKGQTIEFTYLPEKGLYTSVGGVAKPVITNRILAHRLWEVFLGENPLSPDLRRDLVRFATEENGGVGTGVERE